ncbi:hypothetical protein [Flavobacterium sp.]|uniref:tetratricopeptide repeat protein n=1 Tax=Flavobacterium sp. TaxID=239 RepID=UPI002BE1157B|nr:hypothetical protein [Flavobacterium sp.]HSD06602.1 hypothetical protein [Flavobacterium sp.]
MKNLILTIFLFISIKSTAQLTFDKSILDCENKWVAFPQDDDGSYKYGFIYMDSQYGLIFDYGGSFRINAVGKILASPKEEGASMKMPLNPSKILLAIIPETDFEQFKINKISNGFNSNVMKQGSVEWFYSWGTTYNTWSDCKKALESLEKAYKINSQYKGLDVQLAHSYNCLNQYSNAINVLKKSIVANPTDPYVNKEYIFALAANQQLDLAIESYKKSLKVCPDTTYVPENAFYILQGYFFKNDKKNFDKWLVETETVMYSNDQIKKIVEQMKIEIKKNK